MFRILTDVMREYNIPYIRNPIRRPNTDIFRPKEMVASWREWWFYKINKKHMKGLEPYTDYIAEFNGSVEILTH